MFNKKVHPFLILIFFIITSISALASNFKEQDDNFCSGFKNISVRTLNNNALKEQKDSGLSHEDSLSSNSEVEKEILSDLKILSFSQSMSNVNNTNVMIQPHAQVEAAPSTAQTVRILSIDGGGIRGLVPAVFLDYIETKLRGKLKVDVRIAECFDIIAGTSTGGIIALALVVPDETGLRPYYSAAKMIELYQDNGKDIFPPSLGSNFRSYFKKKYNADALEKKFEEYFQNPATQEPKQQVQLSETLARVLITAYDFDKKKLTLFDSKKAKKHSKHNYELRHVARSTSAAPTFFASAQVKPVSSSQEHTYIDGGVVANNPTLAALIKSKKTHKDAKEFHVVSLGTGKAEKIMKEKLKEAGKLGWASEIPSLMMSGASQLSEDLMQIIERTQGSGVTYSRLQAFVAKEAKPMDKIDSNNLKHLTNNAENVAEGSKEMRKIIESLVIFCKNDLCERRIQRNSDPKKLDLHGIPLKANSGNMIRLKNEFLNRPTLILLDLSNTGLEASALSRLIAAILKQDNSDAPALPLKQLNLSRNNLQKTGFLIKELLGGLTLTLKTLIIQQAYLEEQDIKNVALEMKKHGSLRHVDMSFNQISNQGALWLADALKQNISLTTLKLKSTGLTPAALNSLKDVRNNLALEY